MLRLEPLAAFEPVRLGSACVVKLPVRGKESFHNLIVQVTGQGSGVSGSPLDVVSVVDKFELEQDGVTVFSADPYAIRLLGAHMNTTGDAYFLDRVVLPLARIGYGNSDWPSGGMDKFFLKAHTKSALAANSQGNPALTFTNMVASARLDILPAPAARGSVFSLFTATHTTVPGTNTIENLPVGPLRRLTRIIAYCPVAPGWTNNPAGHNIEWVRVHIGRDKVYESTKAIAVAELADHPLYRRTHFDGNAIEAFPIMFDYTGREADFVKLVEGDVRKNVKVEFGWKAGEAVEAVNFLMEGALDDEKAPLKASV